MHPHLGEALRVLRRDRREVVHHPGVGRRGDLEQGYDLVLAVGVPRETSLITRKVAELENGLFAAPA
jgi:hypothetical protein